MPARLASSRRTSVPAEEARAVVAAAKYPPLGRRGAREPLPHLQVPQLTRRRRQTQMLNEETMVIVQFKSSGSGGEGRRDHRRRGRRHGADRRQRLPRRLSASPGSSSTRCCARPTRSPSRRPASMASTQASAAWHRHPQLAAEFVKMGARYVSTGTDLGLPAGRGDKARATGAGNRHVRRTQRYGT